MLKISCFLVCVILLQNCSGLNVCGFENVPKAVLSDTRSIENMFQPLTRLSITATGNSYFLTPLDPLELKDITFTVADERFIMRNVKITGLLKSSLEVTQTGSKRKQLFRFRYSHNLILEAGYSIRIHMKTGEMFFFNSTAKVEISDVVTDHVTDVQKLKRCDGNNYILLNPTKLEVGSGVTNIISGVYEQLNYVDVGDFGMALVETVGALCTEAINKNNRQFLSIVKYDDIVAK